MKKWLLSTLANTINVFIKKDLTSHLRLQKLQGKSFTIEIIPLHLQFHILFNGTGISIENNNDAISNAKIIGTPIQLLNVLLSKKNRQQFFLDDLKIEGDIEFVNEAIALFETLQIDWEEELSQIIGDVPAYRSTQFLKHVRQSFHKFNQSLSEDFKEYIHEEAVWLPSREALNDFFEEVDTLRMDVDRIEVKVHHLLAHKIDHEEE